MSTFVIAELGSCHNNDLDEAKRLIDVAKACGANAAKFQYWSSAHRMAMRRHAPQYEAVYQRWQMPFEWLLQLREHAEDVKIEFMCSAYLPEDVQVIAPLVNTMKIASFEANDPGHLVAHVTALSSSGGRVLVSLGLDARVEVVREYLIDRLQPQPYARNVFFLRCVSAYPAPIGQLELRRLTPRNMLEYHPRDNIQQLLDGLSDHSAPEQVLTGALAVAAGGHFIERHLRNDSTPSDNPDYPHAMHPVLFKLYVDNIRMAEEALAIHYDPAPAEAPLRAMRVRE